jgi:protein-tyrosine-phosphatase/predicted ATP-grasp superfamily ATP-dependent carboligase
MNEVSLVDRKRRAMRALVLDAGSPAGVETVQALGRAGLWVDATDTQPSSLAFRSRYPTHRLVQPTPARPWEFLEWLAELDEAHGYTLIVPATEGPLFALRRLPARDPLRKKAVLPPDEALDTALDKRRTAELAGRLGIPVPESCLIESLEGLEPAAGFPLVLKPVKSTVTLGDAVVILSAALVRDEDQRRAALRERLPHGPVQQQRYVAGHGVGVELLFDRGREVWHFAHERIHEVPLTGGGSSYRCSVRPPAHLLAAARELLSALEWHGVAMVEFRVEAAGRFYLMEVNPRLWGSLALPIDAGVNFPLGLWRIAAGEPHPSQPAYREGYFTRHLAKDLEWLRANWRADHRDPALLTRPRASAILEYARPLFGRESWDHFDVGDLGVMCSLFAQVAVEHARKVVGRARRALLVRRLVKRHARRFGLRADHPMRRLLFVCYGNVCRSPFAERLARARLDGCAVDSAGLLASAGQPSPERLVRVAGAMGVDLGSWRSKRLDRERIAAADLVVTMDPGTYERLAAAFPEAVAKTTLLGLFAPEPRVAIPDPYTMGEVEVRGVLEQIRAALDGLATWLGVGAPAAPAPSADAWPQSTVKTAPEMVGAEVSRRCVE